MKQVFRILMAVVAIGTVTFFAACNNNSGNKGKEEHVQHDTSKAAHDGDHTYACPMHPEVTSATASRCPKCGMKLVKREEMEDGDGH